MFVCPQIFIHHHLEIRQYACGFNARYKVMNNIVKISALYGRVSQLWYHWHFRPDNSLLGGAFLCILEHMAMCPCLYLERTSPRCDWEMSRGTRITICWQPPAYGERYILNKKLINWVYKKLCVVRKNCKDLSPTRKSWSDHQEWEVQKDL
jgi:hypothetical protein